MRTAGGLALPLICALAWMIDVEIADTRLEVALLHAALVASALIGATSLAPTPAAVRVPGELILRPRGALLREAAAAVLDLAPIFAAPAFALIAVVERARDRPAST